MNRAAPLGVDIGSTRVRIAVGERRSESRYRLCAVASRDLPDGMWRDGGSSFEFAVMVVEELLRELNPRVKECVTAIGAPYATLRTVHFPKMSWLERKRAARFEIMQGSVYSGDSKAAVRVHPIDRRAGLFAIAMVDGTVLRRHVELLRKTGLRVVAVDHDAYALNRSLPEFDAVADIGYEQMRLHVYRHGGVASWATACGGSSVTQGIAADLSIDLESAERRKRILGVSGAGESACEVCVRELSGLLDGARRRGHRIARVALVGNGARLPGFAASVGERSGICAELPVANVLRTAGMSDEVLCTASPDWTLAAALAGWNAA